MARLSVAIRKLARLPDRRGSSLVLDSTMSGGARFERRRRLGGTDQNGLFGYTLMVPTGSIRRLQSGRLVVGQGDRECRDRVVGMLDLERAHDRHGN